MYARSCCQKAELTSSSSSSPSTTSLSLLSLTPPPHNTHLKAHKSSIPLETAVPNTGRLLHWTTDHLRLYQLNDIRDSKAPTVISCIPCAAENLSEIYFVEYLPLKRPSLHPALPCLDVIADLTLEDRRKPRNVAKSFFRCN